MEIAKRNLLLISNDQTLIEIFQQLEGFELTVSPHTWYVEPSDAPFDVAIVDADFARITSNIRIIILNTQVAFAILANEALQDFLNSQSRYDFFDVWVKPLHPSLVHERIMKAIEYKSLFASRSKILNFYSHEIQNPTAKIRGYSDVLLRELTGELNEQQKNFIGEINKSANEIRSILERLQPQVVVISANSPVEVDFYALVIEELRRSEQFLLEEKIKIEINFSENLPKVFSNHLVLFSFFASLFSMLSQCQTDNRILSISASVESGFIHFTTSLTCFELPISTNRQSLSEVLSLLHSLTNDNQKLRNLWLMLTVLDSRFYDINADIFIESELGKGTTFYFTLPIAKDEAPK